MLGKTILKGGEIMADNGNINVNYDELKNAYTEIIESLCSVIERIKEEFYNLGVWLSDLLNDIAKRAAVFWDYISKYSIAYNKACNKYPRTNHYAKTHKWRLVRYLCNKWLWRKAMEYV